MTTNSRYLSATNTHLPVATGMVVGYIRDPAEFAFMEYTQLVESKSVTGLYYTLDSDHPISIRNRDQWKWAPGSKAPQGNANLGTFKADDFVCERFAFPFTIGEEAVEQARDFAGWDPLAYEAKSMAQQAMTLRTMDIWTSGGQLNLDNPSNWPSANTASAATLSGVSGGTWTASTPQAQVIKLSIIGAARIISLQTGAVVKMSDLCMVLSPTAAMQIAASPEIVDFVKQQASSPEILMNTLDNPNALFGLPRQLYGMKIRVEASPYITALPVEGGPSTTPGTRLYAKADNYAVILARKGAIDAPFGAKSWSTVQCYWHKYDLAVESQHLPWDKLHEGRVVDYRCMVTPSLASGFNITNILQ